jgi:1,4-alpha-glucan branching enzyme
VEAGALPNPSLPFYGHVLTRPRVTTEWPQLPASARQPSALAAGSPPYLGSFPYRVEDAGGAVTEQGVTFRVWAPNAKAVAVLDVGALGENGVYGVGDHDVGWTAYLGCQDTGEEAECLSGDCPCESGVWSGDVPDAWVGSHYRYLTATDAEGEPQLRRDPRGLLAEGNLHGSQASVVYDAFEALNAEPHVWSDRYFIRPRERELVLIHATLPFLGGSFEDAIEELAPLRELGANAIQLEPVTEHPTEDTPLAATTDPAWFNAYHIGDPFAVEHSYGGPAGYKQFVDRAHREGVAVHHEIKVNFWNDLGQTLKRFDGWSCEDYPNGIYYWDVENGVASDWVNLRPNFGSDEVSRYLTDNVKQWIEGFHVDGFRFDQGEYAWLRSQPLLQPSTEFPGTPIARGWHTAIHEYMHDPPRRMVSIAENVFEEDLAPNGADFDARWWIGGLSSLFRFPLDENAIVSRFEDVAELAFQQATFFDEIYSGGACGEVEPLALQIARGATRVWVPFPAPGHCEMQEPEEPACPELGDIPFASGTFVPCDAARRRVALASVLHLTAPGLPIVDVTTLVLAGSHERPDGLPLGDWSQREPGMWLFFKELIHLRRDIQDLAPEGSLAAGEDVPGTSGGLIGDGFAPAVVATDVLSWHRWHQGGPGRAVGGDDVFVVANVGEATQVDLEIELPAPGTWHVRLRTNDPRYGYAAAAPENEFPASFTVGAPDLAASITLPGHTAVVFSQGCAADADADGICDAKDGCTAKATRFTADADGDGFGNACDADLNNDGVVGIPDFAIFLQHFGGSDALADFDGDGSVGAWDFVFFRQSLGLAPGPSGLACAGTGTLCTGP